MEAPLCHIILRYILTTGSLSSPHFLLHASASLPSPKTKPRKMPECQLLCHLPEGSHIIAPSLLPTGQIVPATSQTYQESLNVLTLHLLLHFSFHIYSKIPQKCMRLLSPFHLLPFSLDPTPVGLLCPPLSLSLLQSYSCHSH